jgi:3-hydroxy-9,10-secoandrosta-1,3,5(10)-triene-9,17-dione monooxygenase reductase component
MGMHINGEDLRAVMRQVPSPVTVVTAASTDEMRGITIGSFTSVSLDPPLISFNIAHDAQMYDLITTAEYFSVHVLQEEQAHLGNHFAIPDLTGAEQFTSVASQRSEWGTPVLDGALAVLHCRPYAFYEAGDHTIVVGEVLEVMLQEGGRPILYYRRAYRSVGEEVDVSLFSPVKRASSEVP